MTEEDIFAAAAGLPAEEQAAYLDSACAGQPEVRARVEALLRSHDASGFMDQATGMVPGAATHPASEGGPSQQCGDRIGRYRLLQQIGEGGFGVVWMAEQLEPVTRRVALKIIKAGMDTREVIARFEAERQALAMMDHPNIAKVLDAGATERGRPFFVMELVKGIPITQFCDEQQFGTRQRLELFAEVCSAIGHAHQKGVIHRDLKPSNVMVTLHGDNPVPKVIDFGIAKATQGKLTDRTLFTRFEQFVGTPAYMSPEQTALSGLDIDTRSDIYALGILLYELLTGKPPFDTKMLLSAGYEEMRRIIREVEPPKPSTRLGTLAGDERTVLARARQVAPEKLSRMVESDLDWIVMKAIEKDRTRRYETANGLAKDIECFLADEPIAARPPSAAYRLQKAWRRNRVTFSAAMIVFLALTVGIGVSLRQTAAATRASHREADANQRLRGQVTATETAKRKSDELLERIQLQRAEELFERQESALAVGYLGQVLRANPSNQVAATRLVSALMRPFCQPLNELLRHERVVICAGFSPDGLRVVTASDDRTLRVWDVLNGQPLTEPLRHHTDFVNSARFSSDGLRVVTASLDGTARVWDARNGQPLTEPMRHERDVNSAQFSPDGLRIVTASHDGTTRVWDARTGQPLTEPMRHLYGVNSAQFSPDGLQVVSAFWDGARVWDARNGQPLTEPMRHKGPVGSAQFSPDGLQVVTASGDVARVWDAPSGQPLTEPLRHEHSVSSAQFSPDGLRVLTASHDRTARVWDAHTGQPLTEPLRHEGPVNSAQFSPDGLRILTATHDRTVRVWDARNGQPLTEPMRHEGWVVSAQFSPDGLRVVTASGDRAGRVWDVRNGQPLTEPMRHGHPMNSAQFSPDGLQVVTASGDGARVWDARNGQPLTEPLHHEHPASSAQFSPDGLRVVTASDDRTARVWDARNGQPLTEPMRHEGLVKSAEFSPDGLRIVTATHDRTVRVWDARNGQPLTAPMRHEGHVWSAQFSPDGLQVVTVSWDGAQVWDARNGQALSEPLRGQGRVNSAQFSPDGLRVVTASDDRTARVWDARNGQPLTEPLRHEHSVSSAQFSPDGLRVVTASDDRTVRVWDARNGQPLTEPMRHERPLNSAQFSSDGLRVLTVSYDGTFRVWDVHSGQPLTERMRHEAPVKSAQFSPDGLRVVTVSEDQTARVWEVFPAETPVPGWFLDWAEARVNRRVSDPTAGAIVPQMERRQLQEFVAARKDSGFYTRVAQWLQADPTTRPISPHATITVPEYVRRRIEENTLASLREAVRLSPSNSVAWARLALVEGSQDTDGQPDRLIEAEFSARQALRLDGSNGGAWRALGTVQSQAEQAGGATNVWTGYAEWLGRVRVVAANPMDMESAKHLALVHLWLGETNEHRSLCREMLELAATSQNPTAHERAANAYLVQPEPDPGLLRQAVAAAGQARTLGPNDRSAHWFRTTAAMAAIRDGNPAEAELLLDEVLDVPTGDRNLRALALVWRAIARAHLGRKDEARSDLDKAEVEKLLSEFPARPAPSAILTQPEAMTIALALEEAKELLSRPEPKQ